MRIARAKITNFRCLRSVDVKFDNTTVLIGDNGVGKSTVLRALDWFFNGTSFNFEADAFDVQHEVEVEVEFDNLTDTDRLELGSYVVEGIDLFRAWRNFSPDGSEKMSANSKSYPPFNLIRETQGAVPQRRAFNLLGDENPELGLKRASSQSAVLEEMRRWEAGNPGELQSAPADLTTNFFGIYSDGKMSKLFNYVFVSADLRAGEQMIDGRGSLLGRILAQMVDRTAADGEIEVLTKELKRKQDEIYDRIYADKLEEISARLSKSISQYSTGRSVVFTNLSAEPKAPQTRFTLSVVDGDAETAIERQGHGFQRTVLLSSLQLLSQVGTKDDSGGVLFLAIEEPELFQHPLQAKVFAAVLRKLANDPGRGVQVMYATHSTYFVEPNDFHQIRRVVRVLEDGKLQTRCLSVSIRELVDDLNGVVEADVIQRQAGNIIFSDLADSLFSRSTILVEGPSDKAYFEGVASRSEPIGVRGVCVAVAGSKSAMLLPLAIMRRLGIPAYVVFDSDEGYEARARLEKKSEKTIRDGIKNNAAQNRAILRYLQEPESDFPRHAIGVSHAVVGDNMEAFLALMWPEWVAEFDLLEPKQQKNSATCKRIAATAAGSPPEFFAEVVKRAEVLQGSE